METSKHLFLTFLVGTFIAFAWTAVPGPIDRRYPDYIVNPRVHCPSEGVFPHPRNCSWYYRCVDRMNIGYYWTYHFECEPGTVFSDDLDQCIFPFLVPPPCGTAGISSTFPATPPSPATKPVPTTRPPPPPTTRPPPPPTTRPPPPPTTRPPPPPTTRPPPPPTTRPPPPPTTRPPPPPTTRPPPPPTTRPPPPPPPPTTRPPPPPTTPPPPPPTTRPPPPPTTRPPPPPTTPAPPPPTTRPPPPPPPPTTPAPPPPTTPPPPPPTTTTTTTPAPTTTTTTTTTTPAPTTTTTTTTTPAPTTTTTTTPAPTTTTTTTTTPAPTTTTTTTPAPTTTPSGVLSITGLFSIPCSATNKRPKEDWIIRRHCETFLMCSPDGRYQGEQILCQNFYECSKQADGSWKADMMSCSGAKLFSYEEDQCVDEPREEELCPFLVFRRNRN